MDSLWQQLRSRKIVEWVIAYLAGGFGLLQLADVLEGPFSWPSTVIRVLTVIVAFGFFAVLIIAWFHGEKGHQRVHGTEVALLAAVFAATVAVSWYVASTTPGPEASPVASPPASGAGDSQLALFDPALAAQSVAVLPFVNITPDQENDYLTEGMTEDIIAELGKIPGLRVISRTSVMRYRDTDKSIPEIGAELSVGAVLEGSVRVVGDQVRITAQLIDVSTDSHVWSDQFDRDLEDILAVQSEVAQSIAKALNAQLAAPAVVAAEEIRPTNPEAYRQFQLGRALASSGSETDRMRAAAHFDSAIALDPEFSEPYAALAALDLPFVTDAPTAPSPVRDAERVMVAAEKAVELNPKSADAHSALAFMRAVRTRDLEGAERAARRAIEANPNSVRARLTYAQILYASDRADEAMEQASAAAMLDPFSPRVQSQMAEFALAAGHDQQAEQHLRLAIQLDSTAASPHLTLASIFEERGMMDQAIAELETAVSLAPNDPVVLTQLGTTLAEAGRVAEVTPIVTHLETQAEGGRPTHNFVAQIQMSLGRVDSAVSWLKQSIESDGRRNVWLMTPRGRASLEELRADPRLSALIDSLGFRFEFRHPPDSTRGPRGRINPPGSRSGSRDSR